MADYILSHHFFIITINFVNMMCRKSIFVTFTENTKYYE